MALEGRINRKAAATILGVTPQTVSNLAERGALTMQKIGKWHYFSRDEVIGLIPKTDGLRDIEKAISEVEEERDRLLAEGVNETAVIQSRKEFIARLADLATFRRYQELVASVYDSVDRCGFGERITPREREVLEQIIRLRPLGEIAKEYNLTETRIKQVFEKALRKMVHFSSEISTRVEKTETALAAADETITRLMEENKVLKTMLGNRVPASAVVPQFLNTPVRDLGLSVRATNCLVAADINTLADLVVKNRYEVVRYRSLGKKSLEEVEGFLKARGLHLGMTVEELTRYGYGD